MAKKNPAKSATASASATKSKSKAPTAAAPAAPRQPGVERRKNHPLRAKNGYMQLILTQKVSEVGGQGDLVKVRPGFARNYLLPQGLATFATPHNLRIVEKHRERLRQLEEAKKAEFRNLAAQIGKMSITIEANANAEGHLYGSVTADQIAEALRADNVPADSQMIRIEGPLKELGLYSIKVNLGHDIETEVKLWVVPTHNEEEVPAP